MKQQLFAAVAAVGLTGSAVLAVPGDYKETAGTTTPPAGAAEVYTSGFGSQWDLYGRVLANADVTNRTPTGGASLDTITPTLWNGTDADLFKIKITDPAAFSAYNTGTTQVLTLFSATGTALGATRGGGTANALTDASLAATLTAGDYYIAISSTNGATIGVARNAANQALFDFSTNGVKDPIAGLADYTLATDPFIAFTVNNGTSLIGSSNFSQGSASVIRLTGADYAVPEPTTLAALGLAGALLGRRRK